MIFCIHQEGAAETFRVSVACPTGCKLRREIERQRRPPQRFERDEQEEQEEEQDEQEEQLWQDEEITQVEPAQVEHPAEPS